MKLLLIFILVLSKISQFESFKIDVKNQEKSALADCIVHIIKNIPDIVRKISILAPNSDSMLISKLMHHIQSPAIVNSAETSKKKGLERRANNDIVIVRQDNLNISLMLSQLLWSRDTKFLLVCNADEVETNFRTFWNLNIVNIYCMIENVRGIFVYGFLPYRENECNTVKPILLDKWDLDNGSFANGGFTQIYEKIRIKNLYSCPINISVVDVQPMAFFPKNQECSKDIDGVEALYLKAVAEKLNFTAIFCKPRDGLGWGRIHPPQGVVGEVYKGISKFGFGFLAPMQDRQENLDLSRNYNDKECITFAVPVGAGKEPLFWLKNIKSDLRPLEWILILLSLVSVTVIFWLAADYSLSRAFLHVFQPLVGQSIRTPKRTTLKYLMLVWILFSNAITEIYQASLGSRITVPVQPPEIETLLQLAESDLVIMGLRNMFEVARESQILAGVAYITNRFKVTDISFTEAIDRMVEKRDCAYIRHMSSFLYEILTNEKARGNINPLTNCIYDYYPSIALQKKSPFTESINIILNRLFERGFGLYWNSLFLHDISSSRSEFIPLRLEQSKGIFTILAVGLVISFSSFLVEILIYSGKHKRVRKQAKPNKMQRHKNMRL